MLMVVLSEDRSSNNDKTNWCDIQYHRHERRGGAGYYERREHKIEGLVYILAFLDGRNCINTSKKAHIREFDIYNLGIQWINHVLLLLGI